MIVNLTENSWHWRFEFDLILPVLLFECRCLDVWVDVVWCRRVFVLIWQLSDCFTLKSVLAECQSGFVFRD